MRLNAKGEIQRNKHARQNWRAKVKRRKLKKTRADGNKYHWCSTLKIRREKVPYSTEEEVKLKELMRKLRKFTKNKKKRGIWSKMVKLGKGVFKACRTVHESCRTGGIGMARTTMTYFD
ncbi:hypothetical protein MKW92_035023 [Papaver armeniacum]|nr:hypothetical protein MKW92_035023 [Papaver armeniacum]